MLNLVTRVKRVNWYDERFYQLEFTDNRTEFYPSSTNILGLYPNDFLPRWRGDVGNREADARMNDAARRGTRIHNAVNIYVRGGVVLYEPDRYEDEELKAQNRTIIAQCLIKNIPYTVLHEQVEMMQATRFMEWFEALKGATVEGAELIVYSVQHRYAGTLDILLHLPKDGSYKLWRNTATELLAGLYVVDLKTGRMAEEHYLQTGSYAHAVEESLLRDVRGTIIVNPSADPEEDGSGAATHVRIGEQWKEDFEDFLRMRRIYEREYGERTPKLGSFPVLLMRETHEEILSGFVLPNQTVANAQVGAINRVAETAPVNGDGAAASTVEQGPAPEAKEQPAVVEDKKAALLGQVKSLVLSVYPQPVRNPKQVQGAANLMHRAFPFKNEKDERIAETFVQAAELSEDQLQQGLPQLEKDVDQILKAKEGK